MGFKALSTVRSGATSAVSRQATVINTSQGFAATGGAITGSTTINVEVVTPGQGTNVDPVSGGVAITSINYLNANGSISTANAVSTAGGNIKINGTGFTSPMSVIVGSTSISNANVSVANSTAIIANLGSASPGNVSVYAFNASGTGAQLVNGVFYSGAPTWTTSAVNFQNGVAANVQLVASSDSTLTYTLQAGSSLPTGISLIGTGYLSGTATGYSTNTSSSAVIVATDAEGQATQQTITWTVSVADPQFPYVSLLLNGETGTNISNNATNNTFVDSSTNNFSITRTGTTTQGSYSPFAQTGWSIYYPKLGYMTYAANPIGTFGTGATFTVEGWVNMSAYPAAGYFFSMLASCDQGSLSYWAIGIGSTGLPTINWYDGNSKTCTGSTTLVKGTWYHVAVNVTAGVVKIYVNGAAETLSGTTTLTNPTGNSSYTTGTERGASNGSDGYISNLRTNTTALYPGPFTPSTTPLTNVANTTLLTAQSNRFIDNSTSARAITPSGSISIRAFSPFSPSGAYSANANGGSAYLDGSGNYLSVATNAALNITSGSTDSFICEFWVNWSTVTASTSLIENGGINPTSFANWGITLNASSQITLGWGNSAAPGSSIGVLPSSIVPVAGQWYHIALVKTNADWSLFINGTNKTTFSGLNTAAKTSATPLYIGYGLASSASGNPFKGYISNVRIYKGATASAPYAATASTITVPTSPVTAITNTQLLTNFTNGGIVDAHSSSDLQTVGGAKLSTAITKFGTASISFSGSQALLFPSYSIPYGASSAFTVEFWIYATSYNALTIMRANGDSSSLGLSTNSSGQLIVSNTFASDFFTSTSTLTPNVWTHVAIVRTSANLYSVYFNGTSAGTPVTYTTSLGSAAQMYIAYNTYTGGYSTFYLDDFRVTNGLARYTANFTAPSSPFQGQ